MTKITRFQQRVIPFRNTGSFSKLILDYFDNSADLRPFHMGFPGKPEIKSYLESSKHIPNRGILKEVLTGQYSRQKEVFPAVVKNIELLEQEITYTVTTGHQLNMFSGPLYILYKLLSTIRLAEELNKQFPEKHFVPIYWMATEDHDIAEINNFFLFNRTYTYQTTYQGAAGKLPLENFNLFVDEIKSSLGESAHAEEILALIHNAYQENATLAEATRTWTNRLFGKYGLVILDPDDIRFKNAFIATIEDDLFNHTAYGKITETIEQLASLSYTSQVQPREINLFYLQEGKRNRIAQEDGRFKVIDTSLSFSEEEIKKELAVHPERFSPNVVLRPLYQQVILPNIAYVGGPAEIAYWMEYKSMFDHYRINFPILFLRNSFLIADANMYEKFSKLGFSYDDIFKPEEALIKKYLSTHLEEDFDINKYAEKFAKIFDELNKEIQEIDETLKSTVESERQRLSNSLKQLEQKMTRALKRKNETEVNQIRKAKDRFFPGGNLQERTETMLPFLLKYGSSFVDMVYEQIDPFARDFKILTEEK